MPALNSPSGNAPDVLKAIVVDDEPAARRGLRLLLDRDPQVKVVGEAGGGIEAVALIQRQPPDLIFLDVQMPGCDGFEVLARVGPIPAAVVFVTAYDVHALRAFEVNAVDYLMKPFDDERFQRALDRAKEMVRHRQAGALQARLGQLLDYLQRGRGDRAAEQPGEGRIMIKASGEILFVKAEEVDWIEAEGDYVKYHVTGRSHLMRDTMAAVEARLDARRFMRIHRSTIVNIDRLQKLSPSFGGEYVAVLHDGTRLKVGRVYQERIAALLR